MYLEALVELEMAMANFTPTEDHLRNRNDEFGIW